MYTSHFPQVANRSSRVFLVTSRLLLLGLVGLAFSWIGSAQARPITQ